MGCLEIQASYVLNATARTGSILLHLPESGVWMQEHILRPNLLLIEGNLFWDLIYNTIVNKLQVNR